MRVCWPLPTVRVFQEYVQVAVVQERINVLSTYTDSEASFAVEVFAVTVTVAEAGLGTLIVVVASAKVAKHKDMNEAMATECFMPARGCRRRASLKTPYSAGFIWRFELNYCR